MAVVAPSPSFQGLSPSPSGDSGGADSPILHELLDELDRERSLRAELEARLRKLLAEKRQQQEGDDLTISRKHYMALQTELQGYRDLIDALTQEKPAIREALAVNTSTTRKKRNSKPPTLPLHMIRVLEIMPWDSRAMEYAFVKEEMFEWQFYDTKTRTWLTEVRQSPKFFRSLPTEEPKPGMQAAGSVGNNNSQRDRPILAFLGGNNESAPPSSCVLTNHGITKLYNLKKGYPLPEDGGTWQWVGGWRVEKRISMNEDVSCSSQQSASSSSSFFLGGLDASSRRQKMIDSDEDGWSYAMEATHFLLNPSETCWDNPGSASADGGDHGKEGGSTILRPVRRRKWIRQRALVDYPYASESTKCFLSLMAQRMYAAITANKISEQLVDTKVALTGFESALVQCKDATARQIRVLEEVLNAKGAKAKIKDEEIRIKIATASDAANQMQIEIVEALSFASREKNCPASPL